MPQVKSMIEASILDWLPSFSLKLCASYFSTHRFMMARMMIDGMNENSSVMVIMK